MIENSADSEYRPLEGRVAIVTGAGRGIGRAHAVRLARWGAAVVVNDLGSHADGAGSDAAVATATVDEILAFGGTAIANGSNVADFDECGHMVDQAVEVLGGLDILITNAGMLRDRTLVSMSEQEWDDVVDVHLKGTFAPAHHAARYWRDRWKSGERRPARLITTSSASGIYGNVGQSNYGAAKAGIAAFTVITSMELDRYGVTVNCLAPSALTRLTAPFLEADGALGPDQRAEFDPDWVARIAGWLCLPDADHVTGRVFDVRGSDVSVAEGWRRGPTAVQPDGADELTAVMHRLIGAAQPNADMNGNPGT